MEDDYNILGNFENLSSVNIAKKLMLPSTSTTETTVTEEGFDLSDIEKDINLGKREKKTRATRKASSSKLFWSTESKDEVAIEENVTKRQTRSSKEGRPLTENASANNSPKDKNRNKQSTGKKNSSKSTNLSNNQSILTDGQAPTTRRSQRGRKKTTDTSNCSSVDTVEILDYQPASSASIPNGESRDVMRARRNYIAERAARCTTVDFVDLITSPMPRVEGVIDVTLDSDDDEVVEDRTVKSSGLLDASFDEENPEISVKIIWNSLPEVFPLRKYQKFEHIFEKLAERANIGKDQVFLNLNNKVISPNDTPASINYKIFQFIYGRAMVGSNFRGASVLGKKRRDPNLLILKVQSDKWKQPLSLELHKTENFKKLIIKCAEELKMPYEEIKLSFDGELLQYDQTPTDLEFEGGELLEIHLKKDG